MNSDNGAICAVREVELPPNLLDSADRLRQLQQVGPLLTDLILFYMSTKNGIGLDESSEGPLPPLFIFSFDFFFT